MALIELREYQIQPMMTQAWLDWMQSELLPYQLSQGMKVLHTSTYCDEEGNDWFIWLREFDNEEARQEIYAKTYNNWWIENIRPKVFQHIIQSSIKVRILQSHTLINSSTELSG